MDLVAAFFNRPEATGELPLAPNQPDEPQSAKQKHRRWFRNNANTNFTKINR